MVNPHGPTILYLLSSVIYAMVKTTRASGDVGRLRHLFWELRELRELLLVALNCIASMLSQGPSSSGPNWIWPNLPKTVLACRVSAIYGLAFNWQFSHINELLHQSIVAHYYAKSSWRILQGWLLCGPWGHEVCPISLPRSHDSRSFGTSAHWLCQPRSGDQVIMLTSPPPFGSHKQYPVTCIFVCVINWTRAVDFERQIGGKSLKVEKVEKVEKADSILAISLWQNNTLSVEIFYTFPFSTMYKQQIW